MLKGISDGAPLHDLTATADKSVRAILSDAWLVPQRRASHIVSATLILVIFVIQLSQ